MRSLLLLLLLLLFVRYLLLLLILLLLIVIFSLFCHEGEGGGKKSTRGCHCPAVSLFAPCLALSFFYLKEKENSFLLPGDGEVGGGNGGYNGGRFR